MSGTLAAKICKGTRTGGVRQGLSPSRTPMVHDTVAYMRREKDCLGMSGQALQAFLRMGVSNPGSSLLLGYETCAGTLAYTDPPLA